MAKGIRNTMTVARAVPMRTIRLTCGEGPMKKVPLAAGIACFVLALIIFIFASGLQRFYSGPFFVMIGVVMAWNARGGSIEKKS